MIKSTGPTWPRGTGQWGRIRTVIVAADEVRRKELMERTRPDTAVVATPLEVIAQLEDKRSLIWTVIAGSNGSVADQALARFLVESYPWIQVVDRSRDTDPDPYSPVA